MTAAASSRCRLGAGGRGRLGGQRRVQQPRVPQGEEGFVPLRVGAVRVRDAQEAQQRIIHAARNLEAAGEIVIPRGAADALID